MKDLKKEMEIVAFAKIADFSGFAEADSVVEQHQLEHYIEGKGRIRMRHTKSADGETYTSTIKTIGDVSKVVQDRTEEEVSVSFSFFEAFKLIADKAYRKKRYFFKGKQTIIELDGKTFHLQPIVYEVDVYERYDGQQVEWCKIDVEIQDLVKSMRSIPELNGKEIGVSVEVTSLPFKPQQSFIVGPDNTPEQKKLVRNLWETEYAQSPTGDAPKSIQASVADPNEAPATKPSEAEGNDAQQRNKPDH